MLTITTAQGTADIAPDIPVATALETRLRAHVTSLLEAATTYVGLGMGDIRMLLAHGDSNSTGYFYHKGTRWAPVTDWIRNHTDYDILFITACNPAGIRLPPTKSTLVYPKMSLEETEIIHASQSLSRPYRVEPATFR